MAASSNNDNQGLKIAVACFVMLSMILAVTTYFGFSNASLSDKKLEAANNEKRAAEEESAKILRTFNDFKAVAGYEKAGTDDEVVKLAKKTVDETQKKVTANAEEARKMIDTYKGSGGALGKLDELKQSNDTISQGLVTPSLSMSSTMERLVELLNNQAAIGTALSLEFHDTRKQLEAMNGVNKSAMDVEVAAVQKSKQDLEAEHNDHESKRNTLILKVDALQTELNKSEQTVQKLTKDIEQLQEDYRKKSEDLLVQLRDWRDQAQKQETVLDKKDGDVTFVDYTLNEIRTNITRRQGAREQMILSVFDRHAPGIPSDKVKGTVQLIKVTDTGSIAKILSTKSPSDPIRYGDQLYSAAWSPNRPEQFALIGKMDVNRDGRDDRADLKRMIESAGGVVVYDLPPPGVGRESGKLTPLIRWFVEDTLTPIRAQTERDQNAIMGDSEKNYLEAKTKAIKTAREDGIRPIPLERLLDQLGFRFDAKVPGRVEAMDVKAREAIIHPRGIVPPPAADAPPAADTPPPAGDTPPPADKPPAGDPK